ncbi:Alpha/Beta hydrolase protein [Mycena sp. CBHHK59/15]|nr:Alpha/Beta hydrolase protein [Mycena sp. CBHHK59/15]
MTLLLIGLVTSAFASSSINTSNTSFDVQPFRIDLMKAIPHLNALVEHTRLPEKALYPRAGIDFGIQLDFLRDLQTEWLNEYSWAKQEAGLNQLAQYTTTIEGQNVHFVHEKSQDKDAIPLLLLHGWPGSFQEFQPIIKPLTESWTSPAGKNVSYNVIVPSLPGFLFSSAPPQDWKNADTARLFNTLMTEVLGYSTYALHASDWGCDIGYELYSSYNSSARAAHFVTVPFTPPSPQEIANNNITLSDVAKVTQQRGVDWSTIGIGYFTEQTYKPNDIGLALTTTPSASWHGSAEPSSFVCEPLLLHIKFLRLTSNPRRVRSTSWNGTIRPNTHRNPHRHVTVLPNGSFQSAAWIYAQNPGAFNRAYVKPATDAPMFFSLFEYNMLYWPQAYIEKVGNLIFYKEHDFGGHFAGLDNPPALIEDLREMGVYFKP